MRTQFYATDKQQEMIEKLYPADTDQHWLIVGQSVSLKPYVELRFRRFVGLPARIIYNAVRLAHWLEGKYSDRYYEQRGYQWRVCEHCSAPCEGSMEGGCWFTPLEEK